MRQSLNKTLTNIIYLTILSNESCSRYRDKKFDRLYLRQKGEVKYFSKHH